MPSPIPPSWFASTAARAQLRRSTSPWICSPCRQREGLRRSFATTSPLRTAPVAPINRPVYITTPIFYVNAAPHVGHMYTMILADVLKRWHLLSGRKALLCTGTDEHGMKIQRAAADAESDPKSFVDKGAQIFKDLADKSDVSYDTFMRTTDPAHREAVQYAWYLLKERGYLYESKHEGWYSVSDETFYPESEVHKILDPATGRNLMVSQETGKEVEWISEVNWRFRLSAFREPLLKWYQENPSWVLPEARMMQILQGIQSGADTKDLSVSRPTSRLKWGIPVPDDPEQTIYVWLDALINYITASGYPWVPGSERVGGWPAYCQIIGKDITRFHCIYWPAFLMALDVPLPERFLTHGHWLLGKEKMAKSTGNVVNPFFTLDRFGVDAVRFFLVRNGNFLKDSSFSNQGIIKLYESHLQGRLGNLVSRILRGKKWNVRRSVIHQRTAVIENQALSQQEMSRRNLQGDALIAAKRQRGMANNIETTVQEATAAMEELNSNQALRLIIELPLRTNSFISATGPWTLVEQKSAEENEAGQNEELDQIIYMAAESLRITGILLQPFMPAKAKRLLDMLCVGEDKRRLEDCRLGADPDYGPSSRTGQGEADMLFPPLASYE